MSFTPSQHGFVYAEEPFPLFVGGFGCVRDSTEIATPFGFVSVADLCAGGEVLSWNEIGHVFQHAPASGSFPKGKANLYRVITEQGEFVASGHHRVRVPDGTYRPLANLCARDLLGTASLDLLATSKGFDRIWSREDDRRYWQTLSDYLNDCAGGVNQCDQRLHQAVDSVLACFPSQAGAHIFDQCFYRGGAAQKDDLRELKQTHNHLGQRGDLQRIASLVRLVEGLALDVGGKTPKECAERILVLNRQFVQFALRSASRQLVLLCAQFEQAILAFAGAEHQSHASASVGSFLVQALARMIDSCQQDRLFVEPSECHQSIEKFGREVQGFGLAYCSTIKTPIIHIERLKRKEWYWDLHVAGNNNYVTKDGVIHHNSGKTAAAIARIMRLKRMCPMQDVAYYLPTFGLVEDIAYKRFPEIFDKNGLRYKLNKQSARFDTGLGNVVFRSMDNPDRIVGYEVAHSICDELDTLPIEKARNVWNKVIARNRQKAYTVNGLPVKNSVAVSTTPEGFRFVYDRWVKNKAPGYVMFKARTMDNAANLPDGYIENLQNSYSSNLLAAYLDGEFVNLTSGSVYAEFDRSLNDTRATIQDNEPLHIGMDFNVSHMAAVVFVLREGEPHAVEEITEAFDTPAIITIIKKRYSGHQVMIYPDASGQSRKSNNASVSDLSLLQSAGFLVRSNPSNPAVKDRVLSMNAMIHSNGARRLKVNVDGCPAFVEGLEKQAYDKNGEPDKTAGLDHVIDAGGYYIAHKFPLVKRTVTVRELRI